jgi:hypothetical protein
MPATHTHPSAPADEPDLSSRYVLVLVLEVVVIAVLYWLGRYFG